MKDQAIVIVEDHASLAEALKDRLELDGARVTIVRDGDMALPTVRDVRPAVLILDIMLPGQTGQFILNELKNDDDLKATPVIITTNFSDIPELEQAARSDDVDYFVKANTTLEQIVDRIKHYVTL